jgi:hypothetical protein
MAVLFCWSVDPLGDNANRPVHFQIGRRRAEKQREPRAHKTLVF